VLLGLYVTNLAIAKKTELNFNGNLVIISGETGAGKSIIMNSIGIACGTNVSNDVIRSGADSASVEASFSINDSKKTLETLEKLSLYDGEDIVVISRTIAKSRGKSLVNGHLISIKELSEIGRTLVDMHGQHEVQSLLNSDNHLKFIDAYSGKQLLELRKEVMGEISRFKEIKRKKKELEEADRKYIEERDFINFEIAELESANLGEDEEEELRGEESILSNLKELSEIVQNALNIIAFSEDNSVVRQVSSVSNLLSKGSSITEKLLPVFEEIENIQIELKEIARDLSSFSAGLVWDPERLSFIEERLALLSKLKLKYKKEVQELIIYLSELRDKVKSFNSLKEEIITLDEEEKLLIIEIKHDVLTLSDERKSISKTFTSSVEKQMRDLAMENAQFEVSFKTFDDSDGVEIEGRFLKLMNDGIDSVEFLIKPNPGEDFKPLASIASGGELSRVMLAIKYVVASIDEIPVLAFDELDAGIGGKTGEKIAEKLLEISKYRQVICITHLPQIASLPGEHFVVEKNIGGDATFLKVKKLEDYERVNEIARMISGSNVTETTIKQSKELLDRWK
jgi:DNA repair protein RecN (Recombination protein N)